jgi:hypothetical protein
MAERIATHQRQNHPAAKAQHTHHSHDPIVCFSTVCCEGKREGEPSAS